MLSKKLKEELIEEYKNFIDEKLFEHPRKIAIREFENKRFVDNSDIDYIETEKEAKKLSEKLAADIRKDKTSNYYYIYDSKKKLVSALMRDWHHLKNHVIPSINYNKKKEVKCLLKYLANMKKNKINFKDRTYFLYQKFDYYYREDMPVVRPLKYNSMFGTDIDVMNLINDNIINELFKDKHFPSIGYVDFIAKLNLSDNNYKKLLAKQDKLFLNEYYESTYNSYKKMLDGGDTNEFITMFEKKKKNVSKEEILKELINYYLKEDKDDGIKKNLKIEEKVSYFFEDEVSRKSMAIPVFLTLHHLRHLFKLRELTKDQYDKLDELTNYAYSLYQNEKIKIKNQIKTFKY